LKEKPSSCTWPSPWPSSTFENFTTISPQPSHGPAPSASPSNSNAISSGGDKFPQNTTVLPSSSPSSPSTYTATQVVLARAQSSTLHRDSRILERNGQAPTHHLQKKERKKSLTRGSREGHRVHNGCVVLYDITFKELKLVRCANESFLPELRVRRLLHEDNQSVVGVLTRLMPRSPVMMSELRKLFLLTDEYDIFIITKYIRNATNVWANRLSRETENADMHLPLHLSLLQQVAGTPLRRTLRLL